MIAEPEPEEAPACIVCMEISITVTDCDHPLCRDCYKKMVALPAHQRNMKKCPYCRKEAPALKNEVIELTDAQKLQHYTVLLDYYTANTVCQNIPPPYAPVVHHRQVERVIPQVPPPRVPPQQVHQVVHYNGHNHIIPRPEQLPQPDREWVRGNRVLLTEGLDLEEARVRVVLAGGRNPALARMVAENPRRIGFEVAGALNSRSDRISLSRMNRFIIRPETREMDIFLLNITYDVNRPAHARTHIDMYQGITLSDLPFNTRPLAPCGCGRKTRRCCIACGCDYCCNACDQCRRCLTGEALRPLPPRFYTITNIPAVDLMNN